MAFGVFLAYDRALRMVDAASAGRHRRWQTACALVFGLRLDLAAVASLHGNSARMVGLATSSSDARAAVRDFKATRVAADRAAADAQRWRETYAGVPGTDDAGLRLDQREFPETRRALQLLATAELGWYRNRGARYREDLVDILASSFERAGLPAEHGIKLNVSSDGAAWWAWRRTITGWCFAIGAAGPPDECPELWQFDGPDPPAGFPGQDESWGRPWGLDARHW